MSTINTDADALFAFMNLLLAIVAPLTSMHDLETFSIS